jgi:HAD superfamily hydrolase (TIGR01509 family)
MTLTPDPCLRHRGPVFLFAILAAMATTTIRYIVFDLGGVIMSGGYLPFIRKFCMECLTPQGKKKISQLEHQVNLGKISENKFYEEIRRIFHVELTPKDMHARITAKMRTNTSLVRQIPKLKPARVALLTNSIGHMAINVLRERHVPIKKLFYRLFLSNQIHLAKPDADAYRFVIAKLRAKPGEVLMVDDRPENIAAAKRAGMRGIVFKDTAQFVRALKRYELAA